MTQHGITFAVDGDTLTVQFYDQPTGDNDQTLSQDEITQLESYYNRNASTTCNDRVDLPRLDTPIEDLTEVICGTIEILDSFEKTVSSSKHSCTNNQDTVQITCNPFWLSDKIEVDLKTPLSFGGQSIKHLVFYDSGNDPVGRDAILSQYCYPKSVADQGR